LGVGTATVDLSTVISASRAAVTRPVVDLDEASRPLGPGVELQPVVAVPVGDVPVFVEAAP